MGGMKPPPSPPPHEPTLRRARKLKPHARRRRAPDQDVVFMPTPFVARGRAVCVRCYRPSTPMDAPHWATNGGRTRWHAGHGARGTTLQMEGKLAQDRLPAERGDAAQLADTGDRLGLDEPVAGQCAISADSIDVVLGSPGGASLLCRRREKAMHRAQRSWRCSDNSPPHCHHWQEVTRWGPSARNPCLTRSWQGPTAPAPRAFATRLRAMAVAGHRPPFRMRQLATAGRTARCQTATCLAVRPERRQVARRSTPDIPPFPSGRTNREPSVP